MHSPVRLLMQRNTNHSVRSMVYIFLLLLLLKSIIRKYNTKLVCQFTHPDIDPFKSFVGLNGSRRPAAHKSLTPKCHSYRTMLFFLVQKNKLRNSLIIFMQSKYYIFINISNRSIIAVVIRNIVAFF